MKLLSILVSLYSLVTLVDGLQMYHQHMRKVMEVINAQSHGRKAVSTSENTPFVAPYTAYMHIYTEDANNPGENWNASIVEYFSKLENGDSLARDDNFYIARANGVAFEDSIQMNFCYASQSLQDSYTITFPTNISQQTCVYFNEQIYDQGCVSYFENMPMSKLRGSCNSDYFGEQGDNWVIDYPGIVYLQYCMKKDSLDTPLYFKSIMNNVTMIVHFALFNDQEPPVKVFTLPEVCPKKK
jgi:hypothetical protein